jgi:hypothetical protein
MLHRSFYRNSNWPDMTLADLADGREASSCPFFSFELEFLVAHRKTGGRDDEASAKGTAETGTGDDDARVPWTCPPNAENPVQACVEACAQVFRKYDEPVAVRYDAAYGRGVVKRYLPETSDGSLQFSQWLLEPSPTTVAEDGSPAEYNWVGVRLRTPLLRYSCLNDIFSKHRWYPKALQNHVRLHVNSTCKFNVQVRLGTRRMDRTFAKKVATLVLLLEPNLLRLLSPDSEHSGRGNSLFDVVYRKVAPFPSLKETRPQDPKVAANMDKHIPKLTNPKLQQMLHAV